jgi:hypothetical protein
VTVLDERGRIGGRFNVIDAAAAVIVVVLVPLAFAGYLLFRTPTPTLTSVVPASLAEGPGQRVEINGTNLRPFMRVTFGTTPSTAYFLGSTKYALVDVPPLTPGSYDVVLFDYAREVARLPKALTIAPIATDAELEVEGAFKTPSPAVAAEIKAGASFSDAGREIAKVVAVGGSTPSTMRFRVGEDSVVVPLASHDLAATLQVKCIVSRSADGAARCVVPIENDRVVIAPDALLTFRTAQGPVLFQIARAHAPRSATNDAR